MSTYVQEYDARVITRARELANLFGAEQIRAWYIADGHPLDERDDPYAAALGTLQGLTQELLCMAARNA